jgi:hypothetical protein
VRASRPTEGKRQYSIVFEAFPKLQKLKYRIKKYFPHAEKPPPKRGLEAVDKVVGIAITVRKRV